MTQMVADNYQPLRATSDEPISIGVKGVGIVAALRDARVATEALDARNAAGARKAAAS